LVVVDHAARGLGPERISHVVVLIMEDRSFGHLLSFLQDDDLVYLNLNRLKPSWPVDPSRPDGKVVILQPLPQDRTDLRAIAPRTLSTIFRPA
jgi:hypothetical protein